MSVSIDKAESKEKEINVVLKPVFTSQTNMLRSTKQKQKQKKHQHTDKKEALNACRTLLFRLVYDFVITISNVES